MFKTKRVKELEQKLDFMEKCLDHLTELSEDQLKNDEELNGEDSISYYWDRGYLAALENIKWAFENWE